jgi:hypothetical protein
MKSREFDEMQKGKEQELIEGGVCGDVMER